VFLRHLAARLPFGREILQALALGDKVPRDTDDQRSSVALGFDWASRITAVSLEMVLPGIGGQWLDKRYGTSFLALVGFAFGLTLGITHLLAMTRSENRSDGEDDTDKS
jgi:hypothetical protein